MNRRARSLVSFALAGVACLQWPVQRFLYNPPHDWRSALASGLAVLGAAFLLSWAGEAAELDAPQGLALAALAIVAVLPEYAVDVYFAWMAGKDPSYAGMATANMTGSNRLLIGLGWPAVLAAAWPSGKREVKVGPEVSVELLALFAATLYAFFAPLNGLSLLDFAVFTAIFVWYAVNLGGEQEELELEGAAALLGGLPKRLRVACVLSIFAFAAAIIYLSAEPFAEGLVATGKGWGLSEFFLVQWVAPIASEAPEFTVAMLFALKGRARAGLRVLISSKVSQWTLLVGMLPLVYSISSRSATPLPLDALQHREILLTAAQSLFGLALLVDRRFTWKEAAALAILFAPQPFLTSALDRDVLSGIFLLGAFVILARPSGWSYVRALMNEARAR